MAYLHDNWLVVRDEDIVTIMLLDNNLGDIENKLGDKIYRIKKLKIFFEARVSSGADCQSIVDVLNEHYTKAEQLEVKYDLIDFLEVNENDNVTFIYKRKIDIFHKECSIYRVYLESIEKWLDALAAEYAIDENMLPKRPSIWDDDESE